MTRVTLIVTIAAMLLPVTSSGTAVGTDLNDSQRIRYQRLCEALVAPCCWRESVAMHRSPEALRARDEVAALILEGKSDHEILDDFVSRYGARVLMEPSGSRSQWLYVLPFLVLLAGVLSVVHFLRSRTRRKVAARASPSPLDDSEWDW